VSDIAGYLAASRRKTDKDNILQFEGFDEFRKVIGIGVHVVAIPGLARPTMTPPIMRNATVAVGCEEEHLRFPTIRTERPAVAKHYGLPRAPVLEINLRSVFGCNCAHVVFLRYSCSALFFGRSQPDGNLFKTSSLYIVFSLVAYPNSK
jgi:hypothetical protein